MRDQLKDTVGRAVLSALLIAEIMYTNRCCTE